MTSRREIPGVSVSQRFAHVRQQASGVREPQHPGPEQPAPTAQESMLKEKKAQKMCTGGQYQCKSCVPVGETPQAKDTNMLKTQLQKLKFHKTDYIYK